MKTHQIFTAGLLALSAAGIASAQTNIKWTGSTAYRKATWFAAVSAVTNPKISIIGSGGANDTADDVTGASQGVITGTIGSTPVTIQLAFQGSVGGVHAVVTGATQIPGASFGPSATWLSASNTSGAPAPVINATAGTIKGSNEVTAGGAAYDAAAAPNVTNSDSFLGSTPDAAATNVTPSSTDPLGVVQFFWVKENDTANSVASRLTNITPLQANLLLASGELPLSFFTGNTSDAGTDVVLVGRNNDSGTRLDAEAEAYSSAGAFGFGQNTENQYQPTLSGGLVNGVTNVGDAGYVSGGNVATALKTAQTVGAKDDANNPFIFVGYVGLSDKNTAIGGGATVLTYGGVDGTNNTNIEQGAYTYWAYEHTYYLSTVSTAQASLINSIANLVAGTYASQSGIPAGSMTALRFVEGGTIFP